MFCILNNVFLLLQPQYLLPLVVITCIEKTDDRSECEEGSLQTTLLFTVVFISHSRWSMMIHFHLYKYDNNNSNDPDILWVWDKSFILQSEKNKNEDHGCPCNYMRHRKL